MTTSGKPESTHQSTAMFMRSVLRDAAEEAHIVQCPACVKATVPVPDPQRGADAAHCYRCGAEYRVAPCGVCGAAAILSPTGAVGDCLCEGCRA